MYMQGCSHSLLHLEIVVVGASAKRPSLQPLWGWAEQHLCMQGLGQLHQWHQTEGSQISRLGNSIPSPQSGKGSTDKRVSYTFANANEDSANRKLKSYQVKQL